MLQIRNATPFATSLMLLADPDGVDTLYSVVKATFTIGEKVGVADEQVPVAMADTYHDDPQTSSIRVPSDICLGKMGTDVLLIGSAWAPGGRPVWQMDVSVTVGSMTKALRVFGDRVWQSGAAGATPAWVAPFLRMPLVWERAFGGTDHTETGPCAFRRNPVGAGFRAKGGSKPIDGLPLPNVEDPASPISSPADQPGPGGFAPVAPHWEPRIVYAGTYDEGWQKGRAPYLPADFDKRFFQVAPTGLIATGFLRGGELVELQGATPNGVVRFLLPEMTLKASYQVDRTSEEQAMRLDTIVLEPDAERLIMVWRAGLRCDKKALRVREVGISIVS